jgi:hypothetical protein
LRRLFTKAAGANSELNALVKLEPDFVLAAVSSFSLCTYALILVNVQLISHLLVLVRMGLL